jgi:hypothetical protein
MMCARVAIRWIAGRLHLSPPDLILLPILVLAAWLRLEHLAWTDFSMDQAGMYHIAQDALVRHAFPVTGILSSIDNFSQPVLTYLYLPFVLLRDPIYGTLAMALANIVGVGLVYAFARRYIGYPAAVVSALFLAVAAWPVYYSRFIWQPNLFPPLLMVILLLIAAGVVRGRPGWLMWALPLWNVAIQLHPAALALGGLLVAGWALAPRTVCWRDVLIGSAFTVALFVPTLIWEVQSNFIDLQVLRHYSHGSALINLDTVRLYLRLANVPDWVIWRGTRAFQVIHALAQLLVAGATLYGGVSVIVPAVRAWRAGTLRRGTRSLWEAARSASVWARAPAQAGWRIRLLLTLWPGLVLLSQLRHYSPVQPHYLMTTVPAQFLLVGLLAQDAFVALRSWDAAPGWLRPLPWRRAAAAIAVGLPLAAVCAAQVSAAPARYPSLIAFPLGPEEAGLTLARQIARRDRLALVVFQPDFFSREAVRYLLHNGYAPGAPTQIVEPDRCLPLQAEANARTLYLFSGPMAFAERFLRAQPGVPDLFAGGPGTAYFRAYEATGSTVLAGLAPATPAGDPAPQALFGGQVALRQILTVPHAAAGQELAGVGEFVAPTSTAEFATTYAMGMRLSTPGGQSSAIGATCVADHWTAGVRAVFFFAPSALFGPAASAAGAAPVVGGVPVRGLVIMMRFVYNMLDAHFGPWRLESAYALANMHFFLPLPAPTELPAVCAARAAGCADGALTVSLAPNGT